MSGCGLEEGRLSHPPQCLGCSFVAAQHRGCVEVLSFSVLRHLPSVYLGCKYVCACVCAHVRLWRIESTKDPIHLGGPGCQL